MEEISIAFNPKRKEVRLLTGRNSLKLTSRLINDTYNSKVVITNNTIWNIWKDYFEKNIKNFFLYQIEDGEKYKNYKTISKIYEFLVSINATRKTALIGFGGGVVGDITGFVASTYHRGVPLIHIPTTVLAQVDSAIGGKTGYNLREGKNLIGTFYQPSLIISDSLFLDTLPEKEFRSGLAEVIKAGCIMDDKLFHLIENNQKEIKRRDKDILNTIIKMSQLVKINVVQEDEEEKGIRAILNFGHTLGHSIEKLKRWRIPHGYAVAIGMGFASYLSYSTGYLCKEEFLRVIKLLRNMEFEVFTKLDFSSLGNTLIKDKKRKDDLVEWVLLRKIGQAEYGVKLEVKHVLSELKKYENFVRNLDN